MDIHYGDICKDYIDYSRQLGAWGTCAAVDCSKMDELADWVGANLDVYSDKLLPLDMDDVQQYGVGSFKYFSLDVVDFFKTLNDGESPEGLDNLMNNLIIAKEGLFGDNYRVVGSLMKTVSAA